MSTDHRLPKQVQPSAAQTTAFRHRLERGITALRTALACLALPPKQRAALEAITTTQSRRAQEPQLPPRTAVKIPRAAVKVPRVDQSPEAQASRAAATRTKKQLKAEREERLAMLKAKRDAEVQEMHRKSGFNGYLRRLPGSFEGGKK